MTLYFFIKTCFNKGAAAATGCLSLLGAVYLPRQARMGRCGYMLAFGQYYGMLRLPQAMPPLVWWLWAILPSISTI